MCFYCEGFVKATGRGDLGDVCVHALEVHCGQEYCLCVRMRVLGLGVGGGNGARKWDWTVS